ncbi:hypothetical protein [Plantibacter sp. CFBP 8775]|uniref:hypothetical protein n=1 Tax=Plantibacter sp. CFBP 8775 TaxID=2774038 RepID=UPI0017868C47|nr:hypothetical protein [Plantibacter sp. CFBP 8775]MBD8104770.1 hypothetical protein [Plantibacter sp. CFBP 8775]
MNGSDITAVLSSAVATEHLDFRDPLGILDSVDDAMVMSELVRVQWMIHDLTPALLLAAGFRDAAAMVQGIPRIEQRHLDVGRFPPGSVRIMQDVAAEVSSEIPGRWNVQLRERPYDVPYWNRPLNAFGAAFRERMHEPRSELYQHIRALGAATRWATERSTLGQAAFSVCCEAQGLLEIEAGGRVDAAHEDLLRDVWRSLLWKVAREHAATHDRALILDLDRGMLRVEPKQDQP